MNAGRRTTWFAVLVSCGLVSAFAQPITTVTEVTTAAAAPPAPAVAVPSDAANVASTTAALPPPAALPGATIQSLGSGGSTSNLSRPDFVKAIWVDSAGPALRTPEGIKKLVADCRDAGFDTIYAQVRANGDALYATTLAPTPTSSPAGYDALKLLLEEAKSGGKPLHVHALLVAYRVWSANSEPPADHVAKQHADWMTLAEDGSTKMEINDAYSELWLDPGVTAAQDHLALIAADLAKNYAVEGIQLDRIRYPELEPKNASTRLATGYSAAAVERFNQEKSKTGKPRPTDPDWITWRRDQVTETVRKIREAVRAVRPSIQLSVGAITFGTAPTSREEYVRNSTPYNAALQDWVGWAEKGLVDVNVLMNFKSVERGLHADFELWQEFALANKGKARAVIGIGGFLNDPKYTAAQMLIPLFQPRADGVALYGYNDTYKDKQYDANLSFVRTALDPAAVDANAAAIASAVAVQVKAGQAQAPEQMAKLDAAATAAGINAPATPAAVAAAMPATTPAPAVASLPQLGSSSVPPSLPSLPSKAVASMPSLPGSASSGAGGLPSLNAASGTSASPGSLTSLPGASAPSASMPPLSAGTTASSMPSLSSASNLPPLTSANQQAANASMPSLPGSSSAVSSMPSLPGSRTSAAASLPPITEAIPGASSSSPLPPLNSLSTVPSAPAGAASSMPSLPSTEAAVAAIPSALPSLNAPALPALLPANSVAIAETTPEANKVVPQSGMVSPIAPLNPLAIPEPGSAIALPAMPSAVVPSSANASVVVESPLGTPITSMAPIPGGPATTTLSVPGTTTKSSVNIPSLGGSTNFDGKPIASAAPASPLITPPTVLTPAAGQTNTGEPINVGKQTVMDAPVVQRLDFSERQSAYGTPNPANEIRNYTTANIRKERHDLVAMPPSPSALEVIVLKTGKEFAGRVLQRGTMWRIELPNGGVMSIPGDRIASTRSTESTPLSVAVTPVPL